jgi:hypothetical protein
LKFEIQLKSDHSSEYCQHLNYLIVRRVLCNIDRLWNSPGGKATPFPMRYVKQKQTSLMSTGRQAINQLERHNGLVEANCNASACGMGCGMGCGVVCEMEDWEDWIQCSKRARKQTDVWQKVQLMLPVRTELTTSGL